MRTKYWIDDPHPDNDKWSVVKLKQALNFQAVEIQKGKTHNPKKVKLKLLYWGRLQDPGDQREDIKEEVESDALILWCVALDNCGFGMLGSFWDEEHEIWSLGP